MEIVKVVLSSNGHYDDKYYEMPKDIYVRLLKLDRQYGYLDAAPKDQVDLLMQSAKLIDSPYIINKYI